MATTTFYLGIIGFSLASLAFCCSPEAWIDRTPVQRVHDAHAVVYGRVLRTYNIMYVTGVYTAEMQVYCVIKGDIQQQVLNITNAGFTDGWCSDKRLETGLEYVVPLMLYEGETNYSPDEEPYSPDQLPEISQACSLTPRYPDGVTAETNQGKQCPAVSGPDTCTKYTEPTLPPRFSPPPPEPSKPEKDKEKSHEKTDESGEPDNPSAVKTSGAPFISQSMMVVIGIGILAIVL